MHIQWISVEHLPPLEDVYLDCNKRVNLFIGTNATGKSTILRAIENLSSSWGPDDEFDDGNRYPIYGKRHQNALVHIGVNYGCPVNTAYFPGWCGPSQLGHEYLGSSAIPVHTSDPGELASAEYF